MKGQRTVTGLPNTLMLTKGFWTQPHKPSFLPLDQMKRLQTNKQNNVQSTLNINFSQQGG